MKKHIVCIGDSNTHGYCADPADCAEGGIRFNEDERWTCLLQKALGEDYAFAALHLGQDGGGADDEDVGGVIPPAVHALGLAHQPLHADGNAGGVCLLQKALGEDYLVTEEGLSGRTTVFPDPLHESMDQSISRRSFPG